MSIVAHFYLAEAAVKSYQPTDLEVILRVVGNATNKDWSAATPIGEFKMTIRNPAAQGIFRDEANPTGLAVGAEYEVVITKIDEK